MSSIVPRPWVALLGFLAVGCVGGPERDDEPVPAEEAAEGGDPSAAPVMTSNAAIWGELEAEPFDAGQAAHSEGWDYGTASEIRVRASDTEEGWAVLAILHFHGGLSHWDLVPGTLLRFGPRSEGSDEAGIELVGCHGATDGRYTYEESARAVVVSIEEAPAVGDVRLTFWATFFEPATAFGPEVQHGTVEGWLDLREP